MIPNDLQDYLLNNGVPNNTLDVNKDKILQILERSDPKTKKSVLYNKILRYLSRPDIFTQVHNIITSSINHAIEGMPKSTEEEKTRRLEICKSCEFFDSVSIRCNSCGCFLEIKTSWASEKCPISKWESVPQQAKTEDCNCNK